VDYFDGACVMTDDVLLKRIDCQTNKVQYEHALHVLIYHFRGTLKPFTVPTPNFSEETFQNTVDDEDGDLDQMKIDSPQQEKAAFSGCHSTRALMHFLRVLYCMRRSCVLRHIYMV
jgi:hypothetical protein